MSDLSPHIADLATAIVPESSLPVAILSRATVTVSNVTGLTVRMPDGTTLVTGVKYLRGFLPPVGQDVMLLRSGTDIFALGNMSDGTGNVTLPAGVQILGSLGVGAAGAGSQMLGDGWFRSYGQTGWYSNTYGYGIMVAAADGYVRAFPDAAGGGRFYSATEVRAAVTSIGSWNGNTGYCALIDTRVPSQYVVLSDATDSYFNSPNMVHMRQSNVDLMTMVVSGLYADVRFPHNIAPLGTGNLNMCIAPSLQIGTGSSSARYKQDIVDYDGGADNPVWVMQPRVFRWNEETLPNGVELNERRPNGQTGFIAEEVGAAAPDAVVLNTNELIEDIEPTALIAYLMDAVQYLKAQNDDLREQVTANKAQLDNLQTYTDQIWLDFYKSKPPF